MSARPFGSKYYEDPSIARCGAVEYDRLWTQIGKRVANGEYFYRAREIVLAEQMPDIHKAFGKEVAHRVQKAIHHTAPEQMPKWARESARAAEVKEWEAWCMRVHGKVSWVNRLSLKLTGAPWA